MPPVETGQLRPLQTPATSLHNRQNSKCVQVVLRHPLGCQRGSAALGRSTLPLPPPPFFVGTEAGGRDLICSGSMLITSCFVKCILAVRCCHTKVILQWLVFLAGTGTRFSNTGVIFRKSID
uniref:Uncharacterized protein n=1 Tax=Rhipicephalus microplus TaxID=6941 RepID=A0A6G5AHZ5_RHIMP